MFDFERREFTSRFRCGQASKVAQIARGAIFGGHGMGHVDGSRGRSRLPNGIATWEQPSMPGHDAADGDTAIGRVDEGCTRSRRQVWPLASDLRRQCRPTLQASASAAEGSSRQLPFQPAWLLRLVDSARGRPRLRRRLDPRCPSSFGADFSARVNAERLESAGTREPSGVRAAQTSVIGAWRRPPRKLGKGPRKRRLARKPDQWHRSSARTAAGPAVNLKTLD